MVNDRAPIPLFRTDAQFHVLGELYTNPGLETTIGGVADRLGIPQATVSREVARLTDAGLLRRRREGNRTLVSAEPDSSLAADLRALLGKLYGPPEGQQVGVALDQAARSVAHDLWCPERRVWTAAGGALTLRRPMRCQGNDADLMLVPMRRVTFRVTFGDTGPPSLAAIAHPRAARLPGASPNEPI